MPLNEIQQKWVNALRSGEYKQGKGSLHNKRGKFCCLGVGCDLAVKAGILGEPYLNGGGEYVYDNFTGFLPEAVQEWLGVRNRSGGTYGMGTLANLNDSQKKSFSEIADFIELQPAGLFITEAA